MSYMLLTKSYTPDTRPNTGSQVSISSIPVATASGRCGYWQENYTFLHFPSTFLEYIRTLEVS